MKKIVLWCSTLAWGAYTFYLTTIPNFKPSDDTLISWLLSNGGHFFFFGILAILLRLLLRQYAISSVLYAIIPVSLYGLIIELLQRHIPGRSADPMDWLLDTIGVLTCLFITKKLQSKV